MELNSTLIVQAIHFAIAYGIIKYLFFQPVYALIQQERAEQEQRENALAYAKQLITQKERKLVMSWQESQDYFARHIPALESSDLHLHKDIIPELRVEPIKPETIYAAVRDVENSLVKKVSHVNHR